MPRPAWSDLSPAAQLSRLHRHAWAQGWQYATVWCQVPKGTCVDRLLEQPPTGAGWELNLDFGEDGYTTTVPTWSDGSVVHLAAHWRRPSKAVRRGTPNAHIHEQRQLQAARG